MSPTPPPPGSIALLLLGPGLALVGFAIVRRNPVGGWLAVIGGAEIAVLFIVVAPWMFPIGLALGLPLLVIGAVRALQVTEARRQSSPDAATPRMHPTCIDGRPGDRPQAEIVHNCTTEGGRSCA